MRGIKANHKIRIFETYIYRKAYDYDIDTMPCFESGTFSGPLSESVLSVKYALWMTWIRIDLNILIKRFFLDEVKKKSIRIVTTMKDLLCLF